VLLAPQPGYGVPWFLFLAILLEASLYLATFQRQAQAAVRMWTPDARVGWLLGSGLVPYAVYTIPGGRFDLVDFASLAGLLALALLFYRWLEPDPENDAWFLALTAAVVLTKLTRGFYPGGPPRVPADLLGQFVWIRIAISAVLFVRPAAPPNVSLWPSRSDWRTGLAIGAGFVPLALILFWALRFGRFRDPAGMLEMVPLAVLTFFGILWVVAVSEEFFFRGMLLEAMERAWGRRWVALLASSVLFGCAHLLFREFPNWKFAILATLAGIAYGLAYLRRRSLGAAMVAHALVVAVWRVIS
jgi:membrane protease YdiL (CAAX protease family)